MTEPPQTPVLGAVSVSVTLPADTSAGESDLAVTCKASWNVRYADSWHADFKDISFQSLSAEPPAEPMGKLDQRMAAALPQLRAILAAAEAAAARLEAGAGC